jgi:peptide/nickel transport system substrate-binding protein
MARSRRATYLAVITPLVIALCCLVAALAAGCEVRRPASNHARQQILYTSVGADPQTFNPILVTDAVSAELLGDVFESLIRVDPVTTLPEPGIAEKWEISPDQKTITFHLRHDVRWFDGQPLTARDVLFTLKVIYDPKVPNSIRPGLLVDGKPLTAAAPDDYTVVIRLPKPFAPLLYSVGIPVIPAHILEPVWKAGDFNREWGINTPPQKIIGDGPYKLARYVQNQFVNMERNNDYWMTDEHSVRLPRLHGRIYQIIPDANATYLRYQYGQLDVYAPRAEEVLDIRQKIKTGRLHSRLREIGIDTGERFFCFNRNPRHYIKNGVTDPKLKWFTDLNFLRAIAHLVDKQAIINLVYHGLAVPAVSDVSPANKLFYNPNLKDYKYDPAMAAQLLESAGYHMVNGRRVDPDGHPIEFNLTTGTGSPEADQICAIFKQDLENLGIKVDYQPLEFTTLVEKVDSTFDWDCVMMGLTGTIDPNDGSNFYRSSGNLHMWNPNQKKPATPWEAEIDRLMDEGASEMDPQKRAPYYWKIQQILHDQLAIIETVRRKDYVSWTNSLENYQPKVWGLYKPEWIQFKM